MRWLMLLPVVVLWLTACSSTPLSTTAASPAADARQAIAPAQLLGGLALPPGSVIRADQSLIIGTGEHWVGRTVLEVGRDAEAAYRFFLETLPTQGWSVVAAVRGRQSLLVMTRQERTLTIEISDPLLGAPVVHMTMAPRNAAVIAPRKP